MKSQSSTFLILLFLSLSGCIQPVRQARQTTDISSPATATNPPFNITSTRGYDSSLCDSIGYGSNQGGLASGIRITLTDKETGEAINGTFSISNGPNGATTTSATSEAARFTCEEKAEANTSIISVFAPGHTPKVFPIQVPDKKLITLDVPLGGPCSMALSCFDNFGAQLMLEEPDKAKAAVNMLEFKRQVFSALDEVFMLNDTGYELECLDCQMGRGGFIRAAGTYENGTGFRVFHHWGWCSSGGGDCGWTSCYSSGDTGQFNRVKANICAKISSAGQNTDTMCAGNPYDNTTQEQAECANGTFDNDSNGQNTISIIQHSNRCSSYPEKGPTNCE